eukprot:CAMPEP_0171292912 /NCGR_PEP_ID=MMETSP0816-20121228/920_1 /TAXON_ID=420281 /ORGANISM="Proboscia inermis, Strain CCAP1064/1" /LENGTH=266 /DNA_ID=CAMNT_0011763135 /DNA_START=27 /DNA_END=827 /DNA_ORIENTATION=-
MEVCLRCCFKKYRLRYELKQKLSLNPASLTLHNCQFEDDGAIITADWLSDPNTICSSLHLTKNGIGNIGAIALAEALSYNINLTELHLGDNAIGPGGASAIAEALKDNTTLTYLNLGDNMIGDEGAIALVGALEHNTTISHFFVGENQMGKEGAVALAEGLKKTSTLIAIYLNRNGICFAGDAAYSEITKESTALISLYLNRNGMGSGDGGDPQAMAAGGASGMADLSAGGEADGAGGAIKESNMLTALTYLYLRDDNVEKLIDFV